MFLIARRRRTLCFALTCVIAVSLSTSCSQRSATNVAPNQTQGALTNPSTFPLYQPSAIVSVAPFDQKEMAQSMNQQLRPGEQKVTPYKGNEVLASTSASLVDLKAWLQKLRSAPPEGLKVSASASEAGGSQNMRIIDSWGADAVAFEGTAGRSVLVMIMDPMKVHAKLGPALDLVNKYQSLPAIVRGPIDQKSKSTFGVSVSEMLDKNSPVGIFVAAVNDLQSSGKRAIVVLDATRE
jgi:hypothetical protein